MSYDDDMPQVSQLQAERVRVVIATYYGVRLIGDDGKALGFYDGVPELFEPGHHTSGWSIAWEGGDAPYEWTIQVCHGDLTPSPTTGRKRVAWPRGVFVEPVNGCVLGIYPA